MRVLVDGEVHVHYSQLYVVSGYELSPDLHRAFGGQVNGLCGAATPGSLYLITGLHTGRVGFRVELHDEAPPVDDTWEDVVEVPFRPTGEPVALMQWAGEATWPLDVGDGDLRGRYCGHGMDRARQADTRLDGQPELDRYLLQFWPAPPGPDQVLKQTSAVAGSWHEVARSQPPPPPPPPPATEEIPEAERRAELAHHERLWRFDVERYWGGIPPTERLRNVGGNVLGLATLDRSIVDAIAGTAPDVQRAIARWAVHRAYDEAGLSAREWVRPALEALDRGDDLPTPFDDQTRVWESLFGRTVVVNIHAVVASEDHTPREIMPEAAALPAIFGAIEPDPLRAALDALFAAAVTFQDDHPRLFRELRAAFPTVGGEDTPA